MPPFIPFTTPLARTLAAHTPRTSQRSFSKISRVRTAFRVAEPHPFSHSPVTHAKADWGRQIKHVGDAALFYFPALALFLGWPLVAEKMCDGKM